MTTRPRIGALCQRTARGAALVFTLWKVRPAAADVSQCTKDTFGLAGSVQEPPFEVGVEKLRCEFEYWNISDLEAFVLNYYPSIQHFADYVGTDMNPERHWEYPVTGSKRHRELCEPWVPGKNGPTYQRESIKLGECSIPQPDGGGYIIQRVGPLVSTGSYDYWQFGWKDVWRTSRLLHEVPGGIAFTSAFSGPVDPSGFVIGHPPIHIHHIHISPEPGVVTKMNGLGCSRGRAEDCYIANLIVEQHGDYQCFDEDGGLDCFFERTAPGYAKLVEKPLDLEGEVNDVRAPDSEPMTWWYQVVLRWHPRRGLALRPLSQHFVVGPGKLNPLDQRHNVAVFPVRSQRRSVYWYSGYMDRDGVLARNKLHSHNTMFDRAFWFAATPAELGLDAEGFMPGVSYVPRLLHKVGFQNTEDLQSYILAKLADSARRYDEECTAPAGHCKRRRPALICQSWVSNLDFVDPTSGKVFAYDRRAPVCCRRWHFHKGDPFTVVALMAPMKTPPGPWAPDKIPTVANMHIHWLLSYDALDNASHYSTTMYAQNPDNALNYGDGTDLSSYPFFMMVYMRVFYNQGSHAAPHFGVPNRAPEWYEVLFVEAFIWFRRQYFYPRAIIGVLVGVLFACSLCCYHCCRASLRRRRSKLASAYAKQVPCCPDGVAAVAETVTRCGDAAEHSD